MIVADASVILKWVLPEEVDRNAALALRERHLSGQDPIVVPELLFYEVSNVLPLRWADGRKAAELFREIHATGIERYSFEALEFSRVIEFASRYEITSYDASYVVLAELLHCRFVTADERLLADLKKIPHVRHLREVIR
ncbi:MAG: type II toxin-antitoxin system VapC family toxin [Candidatus Omnitrophica bacterium]|nr:type II toxin-antitoxin system VapC family toxin [Candidatus Omnitrophota bacterium]